MAGYGLGHAALYLLLFGVSAGMSAAILIAPYVLLRKRAQREDWNTAIMHAYLPWRAGILNISW